MSDNRRDFFKKAAGAAVGLAGAETLLGSSGAAAPGDRDMSAAAAVIKPSYSSARFALELDGKMAGALKSIDGGEAEAEVIELESTDCVVPKGLGPIVHYNPIVLSFGVNMTQAFYDWIAMGLTCAGASAENAKGGAIVTADVNNNEVGHLDFEQALLTSFTLPTADGSSKDQGTLTLKIRPKQTRRQPKPSGKMDTLCLSKNQKTFLASNFKLTIDGLDCSKVSKVESLTIEWAGDWDGKRSVRFSNLVVSVAESFAQPFFDWHEDFVMSEKRNEKRGRLEFRSPTLEMLLAVDFTGLGIFKVGPDKMTMGGDAIKRVTAEMYCNGMTLVVGKVYC